MCSSLSDKERRVIRLTDERLYSKSDAASYLGVSERTIDRWVDAGRLKGRKLGKSWRFTRAQLDALSDPEQPPTQ